MIIRLGIIYLIFFCFFSEQVSAALYINEFSSSTSDSDWIEIYNSDGSDIDLSNYIVRDSSASNKLELSGNISPNGFAVFDWSDRLNNGGDTISLRLKDDENNIIDQITYGEGGSIIAPSGGQSGGRNQDGQNTWVIFQSDSKGSSNNSSSVYNTPTPTPTNTPTPQPTHTPTPAPTNTPTPKPTNTPVPTSKASTPTLPPKVSSAISQAPQVMAANTNRNKPPGSDVKGFDLGSDLDDLEKQEEGYNWWKLLIIMGVVIITGAVGVFLYNNHIKERSEELGNGI